MGKTKQGVSPVKSPLDAGFSHKRASMSLPVYAVTGTTWAGTALTSFRLLPLVDCPVDSRATTQCLCSLFADIYSPK